jgi:Flp pilus assembly protein TadG
MRRSPPASVGHRQDQRGQGVVEFAMVTPLILLIFVGLIDVGRLVFIYNELSEGAREGARYGAVQGRASQPGQTDIKAYATGRLVAVPAPVVDVACEDNGGAGGDCGSGDFLYVTASADVAPITPFISDLIGPLHMESTARMSIHN